MSKSKCELCNEPTKRPFAFWDGYDAKGNRVGGMTYQCNSQECELAVCRRKAADDEARQKAHVRACNTVNGIDAQKLRRRRHTATCTMREASEHIGCSAAQYSAYESERAPIPKTTYDQLMRYFEENRL